LISDFVKANQTGRYVGILDEGNQLILLDLEKTDFAAHALEKHILKFDGREVHDFCIDASYGIMAVLFWNENNIHVYHCT